LAQKYQVTKTGLATKIEEYVPTVIPAIKAKIKLEIVAPPNKYKVPLTSVIEQSPQFFGFSPDSKVIILHDKFFKFKI